MDYSKLSHRDPLKALLALLLSLIISVLSAGHSLEPPTRWVIDEDGGITWNVQPKDIHQDKIEMSGLKVSVVVTYSVDDLGRLVVNRRIVWPMLRFKPNETGDHLIMNFGDECFPAIARDTTLLRPLLKKVHHRGLTRLEGVFAGNQDIAFERTIFPSVDKPAVIEKVTLINRSAKDLNLAVEDSERIVRTSAMRGVDKYNNSYIVSSQVMGVGERTLKPGDTLAFAIVFTARRQYDPPLQIDFAAEEKERMGRVASFGTKLQLETPDRLLNTAFALAKVRATESIFETKGGLMHAPGGGGGYYAAVWANDQAEYANPFFAMFGDEIAVGSAINAYRHFARYMNPDYKPIPSSIISEGTGFWNGAGDRGDMAMIAYGASRFALAYGNQETARELWPLIEWCLEYSRRHLTPEGVVASDSDEQEGQFPAGKANLCTSALHYDALNSAVLLGHELGKPASQLAAYAQQAKSLRAAIDRYFGANVEGFKTYRYYEGNTVLRGWIGIPLTIGIFERKEGTIAALFSPLLWTADGLLTQAGNNMFYDRDTLYALRGVFAAGETEQALEHLISYSRRRLLEDHVPYPVESNREIKGTQLAAESALYCRVYTEGLFGIRPTGFHSFDLTPRLPKEWPAMSLRRIHAFGSVFDLVVTRERDQLRIEGRPEIGPLQSYRVSDGETLHIDLAR
jgi:hypothetical protein